MRIAARNTYIERTDIFEIKGGDVRDLPYSRIGQRYRVEVAVITWRSRDGGATWHLSSTLKGHVLKKDGSTGKNPASESMYGEWPEWLTDLTAEVNPAQSRVPR